MGAYIAAAAWCGLNLMLFVSLRRCLLQERSIFLFQLTSFVAMAAVFVVMSPRLQLQPIVAAGAIAMHGIYSLSFLELWSLAQGGYSLALLRSLTAGTLDRGDLVDRLAAIGERKRRDRLVGLQSGGLVTRTEPLALTPRGRVLAGIARLIREFAGYRGAG
jgi:hypothetical protein